MLKMIHDDAGNEFTLYNIEKVNVKKNDHETVISLHTTDEVIAYRIIDDTNSKAQDAVERLAKACSQEIQVTEYPERYYIYITDSSLPDDDFRQTIKATAFKVEE